MIRFFLPALLLSFIALGSTAAEGPATAATAQYKKVVTYHCVKEPYEVAVPRLSRCGHCYNVYITAYRTKSVPVVTLVKVCE